MNAGQDFMNDAFMCGKLLVPLMGLDDFNREILLLKWILVYAAAPVTRTLGRN